MILRRPIASIRLDNRHFQIYRYPRADRSIESIFGSKLNQFNKSARHAVIFVGTSLLASFAYAGVYEVTPLGLTDIGHLRSNGYMESSRIDHNESGSVTGRQSRYSGFSWKGLSSWFYGGDEVVRIGLIDAEHTRQSDGLQWNTPSGINNANQVLGTAIQYGGLYEDRSAWIYSEGVTHRLGFTDARHTSSNLDRDSYGYQLNEAGQAIGYSRQFNGASTAGRSGWISNGTQITAIGRLGTSGLDSLGYSYNEPEHINQAGQVTGFGGLFSASKAYLGNVAWFYSNGVTIDIGPADATHKGTGGLSESRSWAMNDDGDVVGSAARFSGALQVGQSAWVHPHGQPTKVIGLYTGEHRRSSDGRVNNSAIQINALGHVGGWATNYYGTKQGTSAWLYNGTTTVEVGLRNADHVRVDGTRSSEINLMNDSGIVAGLTVQRATRTYLDPGNPTPQVENGLSAYTYSNGQATQIGLLDGVHVLANGFSSNVVRHLNEAGHITGIATRFSGNNVAGSTAWFYDPTTDITHPLQFSFNESGQAVTSVDFLSETGACLGEFSLYDANGFVGPHAFYWSLEEGFHNLGALGGTGFLGWDNIYDTIVINGLGQALGTGSINSPQGFQSESFPSNAWGQIPVLLTPVPEPATLVVIGVVGLLTLARRRRA